MYIKVEFRTRWNIYCGAFFKNIWQLLASKKLHVRCLNGPEWVSVSGTSYLTKILFSFYLKNGSYFYVRTLFQRTRFWQGCSFDLPFRGNFQISVTLTIFPNYHFSSCICSSFYVHGLYTYIYINICTYKYTYI